MGYVKLKNLLHMKENYYQNQRMAYRMGNKLCQKSLDKGLISRIYKEFKELNAKTPQIIQ
jgi:hypothetical protein